MTLDQLDFSSISLLSFISAVLACLGLILAAGRPYRISRPATLLGVFSLAMVVLGTFCYVCTRAFFPKYSAPISEALWVAAGGILSAAGGVWIATRWPRDQESKSLGWKWSRSGLDTAVAVGLVVCVVGTAVSVWRIGYVPILRGDIAEERLRYAEQAGVFFRFSLWGVSAAILAGVRWFAFGRNWLALVTIAVGLAFSSLYGPRFFPFVAIGSLFILYDAMIRSVPRARLALLALLLLLASVYGAVRREAEGRFVFDRPAVQIDAPMAIVIAGYFTFGEFRDFAWSLDYYRNPDRRLGGRTMLGALVAPIPGPVWRAMGVDKNRIFEFNSGSAMQEVLKETSGIRIGLLGELFMNFGLVGVLLGMLPFGLIVGAVDRALSRRTIRDPLSPLLALVALTLVYGMVGIVSMASSTITFYGLPIVLAGLFASRMVSSPVSVVTAPK